MGSQRPEGLGPGENSPGVPGPRFRLSGLRAADRQPRS